MEEFVEICRETFGNENFIVTTPFPPTKFPEARSSYDNGEFVHSNKEGVNGGGAMTAEFYGETFIPESYARTAYQENFTLENFLFDPSHQTHPIIFFRKKNV